ncbi:palmdelphin [Neopelma chrysocephalum]|uniref:palmdelphin n=1 Tax=Neopelma chrysocephalum TaxID=114329 RepID=UPI000FCD3E98|nr:palmdelphin [Neopelma chrysocephalum]
MQSHTLVSEHQQQKRMEEAELLKERFQAITDKRKLQEEITQKRLKVEEEKMKHQHLKKKALREKWLLDGLSSMTPKEQEEMQKQNQEDQQRTRELEQDIFRLEKEIEALERQEMEVSAKEEAILKKLKSVEKTTEDIIKSVKTEKAGFERESADYIYASIPDLPKHFRPSALRSTAHAATDDEEKRKALFAMEIKVEKDMKTGENTVLSTIPLPSKEFKETGIKVYDDGRKSVYAVSSNGSTTQNGMDELAPVEVEDLLRQATEKNSQSPTEYHEPVFANKFCRPVTPQKEKLVPGPKLENTDRREMNGFSNQTELSSKTESFMQQNKENGLDLPKVIQPKSPSPVISHSEKKVHADTENRMIHNEERKAGHEELKPYQNIRERHNETRLLSPRHLSETSPAPQEEEDVRYNIVQAVPCYVDDSEPVTMVFMGYQRIDDDDAEADQKLSQYDGVIRAELVIIDDDDEDDSKSEKPAYHPIGHYSQVYQPPGRKITEASQTNPVSSLGTSLNKVPHKNSISLQEQEECLSSPTHHTHLHSQVSGDGTEDPSLTALRMRMAKLGKKVI